MKDSARVWRAVVCLTGQGNIYKCDVIDYEGKKWLVPYWLHSKTEGWSMPARIVCLDNLLHQWHPDGPIADATVSAPLPKELFDEAPPQTPLGFLVVEKPEIRRIVLRRMN